MRAPALALLVVALAPFAAATQVGSVALEFGYPGMLSGSLDATGLTHVLLVADPEHVLVLNLDVQGSTLTNDTSLAGWLDGPGLAGLDGELLDTTADTEVGTGRLQVVLGENGPSSLYLQGRSLALQSMSSFEIQQAAKGDALGRHLNAATGDDPIWRMHALSAHETLLTATANNLTVIETSELHLVEWTNAAVHCTGVLACPKGARPSIKAVAQGDTGAGVQSRSFETLRAQGTASLEGTPLLSAFSGPSLSLHLAGVARLPEATAEEACTDCMLPDEQTLRVSGYLFFDKVRPAEDGRLQASMSGDIQTARIDEQSISPVLLQTGAAVTLVAAAGAVVVLVKLLGGAFLTRLRGNPLDHPKRAKIMAYVKEHPGATFREVARETETATGTARHHLSMMKRHDLIVEHPHGSTMRFFENHGKFDTSWSRVVLLREEPLKQLHDWLAARPEAPQKDILEAMESLHGWGRSTTQHRLSRLAQGGLVAVRLQGRLKFYAVKQALRPVVTLAVPGTPAANAHVG